MQVVQYADQVTIPYLKKCIKHVYEGQYDIKQFSEKFYEVLLNDYQNKAYNLSWFLKEEETGRILNYREMTPSATEAIKDARKTKNFDEVLKFMTLKGVEYTPENILENKCIYKKQTYKITKLLPILLKENILLSSIEGEIPSFLHMSVDDNSIMTEEGAFTFIENGILEKFTPIESISININASLKQFNTPEAVTQLLEKLSTDNMKVSIDLADILLAATGNAGSCLSTSGSYHLGTLMNFRSDFTMLCFTHKAGDRFSKNGRTWLYNRITEKGQVRNFSFFKFQKLYGTVSPGHLTFIKEFIYKCTEKNFKISSSNFKNIEKNLLSEDTNNSIGNIGYIDSDGSGDCAWNVVTDKNPEDFKGFKTETPIVFPSPLNVKGDISNNKDFDSLYRAISGLKPLEPKVYMVTCTITNKQYIDTACILIDDKWYSKEGLRSVIYNTPVPQKQLTVEIPVNNTEELYDDLDNDNMEDF